MSNAEYPQTTVEGPDVDELRAWDWRAALKRDERTVTWLARRTDRSASAVHKYASGEIPTPVAWLRQVAIVLGWRPTDAE